jgi:hypothetical protein
VQEHSWERRAARILNFIRRGRSLKIRCVELREATFS